MLTQNQLKNQGFTTSFDSGEFLDKLIDYDVSNRPIYVGLAAPGSSSTAPVWQIKKISYDVNDNPVAIRFAEGGFEFDKVWDDRAGYGY